MLSPIELLGVIDDIKRVAESAPPEDSVHGSEDEDQTENNFEPRDYDIDALHADDARDKVFVAILKALVARHNKPSSPKELANCIMKNEFTILGGATPYATVSSRISQHFKRILEHVPPRPPILGRVAHEKHTRKYFYYVASAQEQEDFLHKVRIGLIPTHSTASASGSSGKNNASGGGGSSSGGGQRKYKSTKKTRCMVPAVAVEPDLSPVAAMRRSRRAASADTAVGTGIQAIDRSAFQTEGGAQRRSSSRQLSLNIGASSTRPRRTSYDGGSHRMSGQQNDKDISDSDSDTNPYARKRYKSVKSAVALAHPRRRSRAQADLASERKGRASVPTVVSSMAPRARRSASYGDTQLCDFPGSRRDASRTTSGAGKWRPSYTSDEDAQFENEKTDGLYSSGSDRGLAPDEADSDDDGDTALTESNEAAAEAGQDLGYNNGSLSAGSDPQRTDNGFDGAESSGQGIEGRRRQASSTDTMLIPPVPNTTPRASASPDTTPFPPATSPYFQPHRIYGDIAGKDSSGNENNGSGSNSTSELQVASPLLLPRGLMSLQMPLDSIFGSSPIAGKDIIPSPAEMLTPVVAAASVLLPPEDSVVPVTHSPSLISTELGIVAHNGEKIEGISGPDFVKHNTTPENASSPSEPTATSEASVASTATEEVSGGPHPQNKSAVALGLLSSESKTGAADHRDTKGTDDYDFSFHDLMDAELMSINELDKLWTNCHPSDDESHAEKRCSGLSTIPEVAVEDLCDGAEAAEALVKKAATDCRKEEQDELSTKLTQKLLALSGTGPAATDDASPLPCRSKIANSSKPAESMPSEIPLQALEAQVPHPEKLPEKGHDAGTAEPEAQAGTEASGSTLDSLESTKVLVNNTDEHEESTSSSSKVILPDPFGDIPATAMVATKMPVSPRIVLTIVETVPVYMTVITTTEEAGPCTGKWIVRRHRLLRLVENGYVNASSLLLAGGVSSEQERSIVLSLEVGRFKWRRPQSKLYGTWIPLPRARALAATCSLNHRLGPFLNDNLEAYFPAPLPTSFIRHLIAPFFTDPTGMLLATADSDAGLGIEFQNLVNTTTANHRPAQSISRSSTFGATARGAPSPSIIQTLAGRPGSFSFGSAAKSIFGSDDRQLQSLLQLLSAESPMLGISGGNERSDTLNADAEDEREDEGKADTKGLEASMVESESRPGQIPDSSGKEEELLLDAKQERAQISSNAGAQDNVGSADSIPEASSKQALQSAAVPLQDKDCPEIAASMPKSLSADFSASEMAEAIPDQTKNASSGMGTGCATPQVTVPAATAAANAGTSFLGVDAHKLAEAISSTLALSAGLDDEMDCDDEMELDMSMVIPGSDNDADMICCSTPPSPPPPPSLPVRQRRISNAPLTIPRTLSPAMSARSMDGASTSGCEDALDDLDSLDSALSRVHSRVHSRAQSPQSQHQQEKQQKQTRQQQGQSSQQQQQQRSPHSGGSFNARLAQTMEAFGFTGSAKTSLLLRLRAAAAAKSTGRQQAVAPYMLYRNSGGSVSGSGSVGGSSKRSKALASIDEDDSLSSAASGGVRKRARVVRIPRVKPLAKAKAKARSVPDASVVMRLASAIYNHTLNMATLAQAQRQSAAASSAEAAAVSASTASALVSATTKASVSAAPAGSKTAVAAAALSSSASARLSATSRAQSPVVRNAGTNSPGAGAVRPPPQRYGSPAQQQQQQQQQQRRVSSPMGQRAPVRPGTAPATPHQNGQPLQYRPGATPTRPPLRRPVMQPGGMAGSGASSPGNTGSSPRVMQQRPTMVRRPPPNGVPHTPPAGGAMRPGHPVRPPTPGSAGQHMRPLQRPTGTSPSTPLRRPPPPSAQHAGAQQPHQQGARPGVPSPRPSPGRPLVGANGMALRPRPPMPNGARPRPAMARQPPLTHPPPGSSGAHVRPGLGVIGAIAGNSSGARPQQQQQQQAYSAQGPVTPVTPSSFSSAAGQQTGAVRPKHLPPHKPQPQPQHQPHCHPQLPKTPVSATAASFARPTGTSAVPPPPSPSAAPAAPVSAPVAPSPVANKNAD